MLLEQFEPTETKCHKWSTISRWKGEIASSFFEVIQWLANGWIIGQCCFYHLPLKEWMTYYQFRGEKRVERPSLQFLVLSLSSFTIVAWVELILWTSVLLHIFWIESHLLDFSYAFSFIWWISHVSIVISCLTWGILTKIGSPWLQGCCRKKNLIQYHQGPKRAVTMSYHLRGKTNLNRLIIMENIYHITKQCETMRVPCNGGKTVSKSITFRSTYNIYFIQFH